MSIGRVAGAVGLCCALGAVGTGVAWATGAPSAPVVVAGPPEVSSAAVALASPGGEAGPLLASVTAVPASAAPASAAPASSAPADMVPETVAPAEPVAAAALAAPPAAAPAAPPAPSTAPPNAVAVPSAPTSAAKPPPSEPAPKADPAPPVAFTAVQAYGSCNADPPYDEFSGTGVPGTQVKVSSAHGGDTATVAADGTWFLRVTFAAAPVGTPFPVTVTGAGGSATFTFTRTG